MKRILSVILTSLLTLIVGSFALIPFNGWVWKLGGLEGGYDDEMKMFDVLVFVEWPILLIIGGLIGEVIYKKYLTKQINSDS